MKNDQILQVVAETQEFTQQAKKLMDNAAKTELINYVARQPEQGEIIQGTGGARKLRWFKDDRSGKRGGVRVIYYYHNLRMPVFLFTVYGKNQKADLSHQERHELKTIIRQIVQAYEEVSK